MQSYLFQVLVLALLLYDVQTASCRSVAILQGGRRCAALFKACNYVQYPDLIY